MSMQSIGELNLYGLPMQDERWLQSKAQGSFGQFKEGND